jgi:hypothetical protein
MSCYKNSHTLWTFVEKMGTHGTKVERVDRLAELLCAATPKEQDSFYREFRFVFTRLRSEEVVNNSYFLLNDGFISYDSLDYFCYWLIGLGLDSILRTLEFPDHLVELDRINGPADFDDLGAITSIQCFESFRYEPPVYSKPKKWTTAEMKARLPMLLEYSSE